MQNINYLHRLNDYFQLSVCRFIRETEMTAVSFSKGKTSMALFTILFSIFYIIKYMFLRLCILFYFFNNLLQPIFFTRRVKLYCVAML